MALYIQAAISVNTLECSWIGTLNTINYAIQTIYFWSDLLRGRFTMYSPLQGCSQNFQAGWMQIWPQTRLVRKKAGLNENWWILSRHEHSRLKIVLKEEADRRGLVQIDQSLELMDSWVRKLQWGVNTSIHMCCTSHNSSVFIETKYENFYTNSASNRHHLLCW